MLYSYNFTMHGTIAIEAESPEEADDLIRDSLAVSSEMVGLVERKETNV